MKRTFRFGIILLLSAILISACSFGKVPEIDEYTWVMWSVQKNDDGQIAAVSSDSAEYFDCDEIIEVTCTAKDGEITFTDSTNDKQHISRMENGYSAPSIDLVVIIAQVLNMDMNYLLLGIEPKPAVSPEKEKLLTAIDMLTVIAGRM